MMMRGAMTTPLVKMTTTKEKMRKTTTTTTTTTRRTMRTTARGTKREEEATFTLNAPLAALVAASVLVTGAIDADEAEAARSGGRVGGGSFRASSRSRASPRMSAQSRTAPPIGGYGYGYNSVFMPMPIMPMYGFGFGFGGMGFLFNLMFLFFVANTVLGFLSQFAENADDRRDDGEDDDFPPYDRRY